MVGRYSGRLYFDGFIWYWELSGRVLFGALHWFDELRQFCAVLISIHDA